LSCHLDHGLNNSELMVDGENTGGTKGAGSEGSSVLIQQVCSELRKLAQHKMGNEKGLQTLSATSIVHEAYPRVGKGEETGE